MKNVVVILKQSKDNLLNQLKIEQENLTEAQDAVANLKESVQIIESRIKEIEDAIKALESKPKKTK